MSAAALIALREWSEAHLSRVGRTVDDDSDVTVCFDARDKLRFDCPDHGRIVPIDGRCPYELPYDPHTDQKPKVTAVERWSQMVVLNGS